MPVKQEVDGKETSKGEGVWKEEQGAKEPWGSTMGVRHCWPCYQGAVPSARI